ncbi:MAG: hypothetical protein ACPGJF_03325 [Sinimarinibacterium flocculans]|uniref:hypothetical protein n=1 Tax=Sinimarinibacterium flocculans TaxID=985250 RepID=UPI003C333AF9
MDEKLGRLRESVLFYVKLDFALVAGIAALASTLQIPADELLRTAAELRLGVTFFLALISYALALELLITSTRNSDIASKPSRGRLSGLGLSITKWGYGFLVLAHTAMIGFISGYLLSSMELLLQASAQ